MAIAFISLAAAATVAGVQFQPVLDLGGQALQLESCGVRSTLWIDHYAAALYVPSGAGARAVRDSAQPKAVEMRVIDSAWLPDQVPQKWRAALQSELEREPMSRVRQAYRDLEAGDRITFAYLPQDGVTMSVNGRPIVRTPGHEVIEAILDAWAGADPLSGKLKRLELKHPC